MPSVAQLLASHGCILVLDAASTEVQVGLLRRHEPAIWRHSADEAGKALFTLVDQCLREAELTLSDVHAFAYCAGPGSMLGVRTVAMALRTWQALQPRPTFQYESLPLIARDLATVHPTPLAVIADARRDTWHVVEAAKPGSVSAVQRVPANELAKGQVPLWQPTTLKAWSSPPRPATPCDYRLSELLARHADAELLHATAAPDAFQHEAPEYKKWSAQVHSAASVSRS